MKRFTFIVLPLLLLVACTKAPETARNDSPFSDPDMPVVYEISPNPASPGETVTITGDRFMKTSYVMFGSQDNNPPVTVVGAKKITFQVPGNSPSGETFVRVITPVPMYESTTSMVSDTLTLEVIGK